MAENELSGDVLDFLQNTPTAYIADAMKRSDYRNFQMDGLNPLWDLDEDEGTIVGPATTMRFVPSIKPEGDMESPEHHTEIVEDAEPGSFVVIEGNGTGALFGERATSQAKQEGVAGVICNTMVRDYNGLREIGIPYWLPNGRDGITMHSYARHQECVSKDDPVAINGTKVEAGDIIVADNDGAVVIPRDSLDEIVETAREISEIEEDLQAWVDEGIEWDEIYDKLHHRKYLQDYDPNSN